jgi:hypothetical protein
MGRGEVHTGFWWGNIREKYNLGHLSVDRRIILKWFFKKWDGGQVAGCCECGNEPSGSIKCGEFLD